MALRIHQGYEADRVRGRGVAATMVRCMVLFGNGLRFLDHARIGFGQAAGDQQAALGGARQPMHVVESADPFNHIELVVQVQNRSIHPFRDIDIRMRCGTRDQDSSS